jgi:Tol biopolymer transport system component
MKCDFFRLLWSCIALCVASNSPAAELNSPMSWSPDSKWLAYTAVHDPGLETLRPGWLIGAGESREPGAGRPATGKDLARPSVFRIWAVDRSGQSSVLIEESRYPLSAPTWGAPGRNLVFSRFVPEPRSVGRAVLGRLEVVIQRSLDEKRVVWTSPEVVLDEVAKSAFPKHRSAWSPDGAYLAVPRPGRDPAVDIIRTDTGKRVHTLDRAVLPAWSPSGTMCAYIRQGIGDHSLEIVSRRGQVFGKPRELHSMGRVTAAPYWDSDGRSILVVSEWATRQSREFQLVRCGLDSSEPADILNLVPDPVKRVAKLRGIAIDFDKDREISFYAPDLENREPELFWLMVRDPRSRRRVHPLDPTLRISAVSMSPDGQCAAVQFGDPEAHSQPALYTIEGEQTTLVAPDETARREWVELLASTAARVLKRGLPAVVAEGQSFERPTILPLPNELAGRGNMAARLARLAELGAGLLPGRGEPYEGGSNETEARLLFDYLKGDMRSAAADLEALDRTTTDFHGRFSILSIRAMIRWAQGDHDQAGQIIAYLVSSAGGAPTRVEDTPNGPVFEKIASPEQVWGGFLATKAEAARERREAPTAAENFDPFDPFAGPSVGRLLELPDFPRFEPGGPFAPVPAPEIEVPARP